VDENEINEFDRQSWVYWTNLENHGDEESTAYRALTTTIAPASPVVPAKSPTVVNVLPQAGAAGLLQAANGEGTGVATGGMNRLIALPVPLPNGSTGNLARSVVNIESFDDVRAGFWEIS